MFVCLSLIHTHSLPHSLVHTHTHSLYRFQKRRSYRQQNSPLCLNPTTCSPPPPLRVISPPLTLQHTSLIQLVRSPQTSSIFPTALPFRVHLSVSVIVSLPSIITLHFILHITSLLINDSLSVQCQLVW